MAWRTFLGIGDEKDAVPPRLLKLRSSKWFIMFVVSFAACTDIFMYGLIVPVTPTALEQRVGISKDKVQSWTSILLALYSAALLAFSPVIGYIADRAESRRWPLLLGLVALGASTALLCVGTNIALWIVGRLCQGAAAAVVWTVGIALMVDTVGKEELGQAIGYVSMSLSIGTLAGPLLGGVLYEKGGYYSVFGLAFGLIGIDIFLRLVLIEKRHAARWLSPDETPLPEPEPEEQAKEDESRGESTPPVSSQTVTAADNTSSRHPLTQVVTLLSSSRLIVSLWGYFVVSLVLTSFDSVLPIFVKDTFEWQQSAQGLIFIPLIVPHITDPVTGFIIDHFPRSPRYLTSGAFLCAVPLTVLLRLVQENTMHDKVLLCVLLTLFGLCEAIAMPPLIKEVFHAVEEQEEKAPDAFGRGGATALAFGLSNMGFAAGSLIGPFFAGFIRQSAGWATMGWAMGLIMGTSAIPILLWLGGWILRKSKPTEDVD